MMSIIALSAGATEFSGRKKKMKRKTKKESVEFKGVIDFEVPYMFCVKCKTEREAHTLKGFLDFWLKAQESKIKYEYYRLSPSDDIVFLFHKSDELDLPDNVSFYRPDTILTGQFITLKKEKIIHREENDFKKLYEY